MLKSSLIKHIDYFRTKLFNDKSFKYPIASINSNNTVILKILTLVVENVDNVKHFVCLVCQAEIEKARMRQHIGNFFY